MEHIHTHFLGKKESVLYECRLCFRVQKHREFAHEHFPEGGKEEEKGEVESIAEQAKGLFQTTYNKIVKLIDQLDTRRENDKFAHFDGWEEGDKDEYLRLRDEYTTFRDGIRPVIQMELFLDEVYYQQYIDHANGIVSALEELVEKRGEEEKQSTTEAMEKLSESLSQVDFTVPKEALDGFIGAVSKRGGQVQEFLKGGAESLVGRTGAAIAAMGKTYGEIQEYLENAERPEDKAFAEEAEETLVTQAEEYIAVQNASPDEVSEKMDSHTEASLDRVFDPNHAFVKKIGDQAIDSLRKTQTELVSELSSSGATDEEIETVNVTFDEAVQQYENTIATDLPKAFEEAKTQIVQGTSVAKNTLEWPKIGQMVSDTLGVGKSVTYDAIEDSTPWLHAEKAGELFNETLGWSRKETPSPVMTGAIAGVDAWDYCAKEWEAAGTDDGEHYWEHLGNWATGIAFIAIDPIRESFNQVNDNVSKAYAMREKEHTDRTNRHMNDYQVQSKRLSEACDRVCDNVQTAVENTYQAGEDFVVNTANDVLEGASEGVEIVREEYDASTRRVVRDENEVWSSRNTIRDDLETRISDAKKKLKKDPGGKWWSNFAHKTSLQAQWLGSETLMRYVVTPVNATAGSRVREAVYQNERVKADLRESTAAVVYAVSDQSQFAKVGSTYWETLQDWYCPDSWRSGNQAHKRKERKW